MARRSRIKTGTFNYNREIKRLQSEIERVKHASYFEKKWLLDYLDKYNPDMNIDQKREFVTTAIIRVSKLKTQSERVARSKQTWRVGGGRSGMAGHARFAAATEDMTDDAAEYLRGLEPSDEAFDIMEALDAVSSLYTYDDIVDAHNKWRQKRREQFLSEYGFENEVPDITHFE